MVKKLKDVVTDRTGPSLPDCQVSQGHVNYGEAPSPVNRPGRYLLQEKAKRLREEADQLDALARALPGEMSKEAEDGLFSIAVRL